MNPTAAAEIEEHTTMTTPPALTEHPDVVNTRRTLADQMERMGPDEGDQRRDLAQVLELLEVDPTVALFAPTQRTIALIQELARQRRPLARQAALAREHERLSADPEGNRRALNQLGKTNPRAIEEHAALRTRTAELLQELRTLADPAWTTPQRRRALADERMPPLEGTCGLSALADQLRRSVRDALAIDPTHPQALHLVALAEAIENAHPDAQPRPTPCAGPGCTQPLPPADRGRQRRYCSPPCRTRARRAAGKR